MNPEEKQDKIPEVWEGHNIADYIDPEIMKVWNKFLDFQLFKDCNDWYQVPPESQISSCSYGFLMTKLTFGGLSSEYLVTALF